MSAMDTASSQQDSMVIIEDLVSAEHMRIRNDGTGTALRTRRTEIQPCVWALEAYPQNSRGSCVSQRGRSTTPAEK